MKRRFDGSLLVSIVVHIVLGAGLIWVLSIPYPFHEWLEHHKAESIPVERISFLALPNRGTNTPGRNGGDGRPLTPPRPATPIVAPAQIPSGVPSGTPAVKRQPETGSGPVVGTGGAKAGITPSYSDPRVWLPPGTVVSAPKTPSERLDSALIATLQRHQDSLAEIAANAGRAPGDWTVQRNGKKYGIDSKKIYIGDHSLPTAILALLPLNRGGNPIAAERERALNAQRSEIMEQAQRAMNAEDFREAVKRIRQRKEREHEEEMKQREEEKKKQEKVISSP